MKYIKKPIEIEAVQFLATDYGNLVAIGSLGLNPVVVDDKIKELLSSDDDLDKVAQNLIDFANETAGKDNVSVIVIEKS